MKIYTEKSLKDFDFWSGAKYTVKYLTEDEINLIETILEDSFPEGISETEINDFFWFEDDSIAEWLGYSSFDDIINRENDEC